MNQPANERRRHNATRCIAAAYCARTCRIALLRGLPSLPANVQLQTPGHRKSRNSRAASGPPTRFNRCYSDCHSGLDSHGAWQSPKRTASSVFLIPSELRLTSYFRLMGSVEVYEILGRILWRRVNVRSVFTVLLIFLDIAFITWSW